MTPTEILFALARLDGWVHGSHEQYNGTAVWQRFHQLDGHTYAEIVEYDDQLPNYPTDLNALNRVVGKLSPEALAEYRRILSALVWGRSAESADKWNMAFAVIDAPAPLRAEAILRAVGKWKD